MHWFKGGNVKIKYVLFLLCFLSLFLFAVAILFFRKNKCWFLLGKDHNLGM